MSCLCQGEARLAETVYELGPITRLRDAVS
jgi:hypothetical protein